jgi:hypothetical protein
VAEPEAAGWGAAMRPETLIAREQSEIERRSREAREQRICAAARKNPDIGLDLLGERFGVPWRSVANVLQRYRIRLERCDARIIPWGRVRRHG